MDLIMVWAMILSLTVLVYVVLDGFDLGLGIVFRLFFKESHRDALVNSIAPVWDGNETWLILGGGSLFAAFPLAYSILLPAVYAPTIVMLLGLVFRGVAFEFRWRTKRWKTVWDIGFFLGSFAAAFSQGIILGAIIQGIEVADRAYAGGWFNWLTPFSLLTGFAVVSGYCLLGATWLVMKTAGDLQNRARKFAYCSLWPTVVSLATVSLWTPFIDDFYFIRWFSGLGLIAAALVRSRH